MQIKNGGINPQKKKKKKIICSLELRGEDGGVYK